MKSKSLAPKKIIVHLLMQSCLVLAALLTFGTSAVYAAWDGNPYAPDSTLDPGCSPSQTNCDVMPVGGSAVTLPISGSSTATSSDSGLELDGSQLALLRGCSSDQILKWSGAAWDCANDQNTTYGAGNGLTMNNNTVLLDTSAIVTWTGAQLFQGGLQLGNNTAMVSLVASPTADRSLQLQDASGTVALTSDIKNNLAELNDTAISTPTAGNLLLYDGSAWSNLALSGAISVDGTGTVTLNGGVALGSDTTGDYVASLVAGRGLFVAGTGNSAGDIPTIGINTSAGLIWTGSQTFQSGIQLADANTLTSLTGPGLLDYGGTLRFDPSSLPTTSSLSSSDSIVVNQGGSAKTITKSDLFASGIQIDNATTTGTALAIDTDDLTSGAGLAISSSATAMTGNLAYLALSGDSAGNTGNMLYLNSSGTTSAATGLKINVAGTGLAEDITGAVAWRSGTTYTSTGTQNDINLGNTSSDKLNPAANLTITGLKAGTDGQLLTLMNVSSNTVTLANKNTGSLAANRIATGTANDVIVAADASVIMQYDGTTHYWRLLSTSTASPVYGTTVITAGSNATTSTTYVDVSGSDISLPSAGTWEVHYSLGETRATAGQSVIRLVDASNVAVANSVAVATTDSAGADTPTVGQTVYITTNGAATYHLQHYSSNGASTAIGSTSSSALTWKLLK